MTAAERASRPATILWRRLDAPGHDAAELAPAGRGVVIRGVALFSHAGLPCRFEYEVECDPPWHTVRAALSGHVGGAARSLELARSASGEWRVDGAARPELAGCDDVDLSFTPATNTLAIRRLALAIGATATVRAAWVRSPELAVEVLEQGYTRTGARAYHYETGGGAFRRDLTVDASGLVLHYPDFWRAEARAGMAEPNA